MVFFSRAEAVGESLFEIGLIAEIWPIEDAEHPWFKQKPIAKVAAAQDHGLVFLVNDGCPLGV